ncbi:MAG: type II toxin-antitoxin system RelE/ParE family toxin [Thiotrichales bacterium]|nr:type II toxin-antitoxin system RelE/ParE family toxin [Thiotrichales bacterium]
MNYELQFHELALQEWRKLDPTLQQQFKKKLEEGLIHPRVPSARLRKMENCYKIKLRRSGFRLIYRVEDEVLFVSVIAVGKRERGVVYKKAEERQ